MLFDQQHRAQNVQFSASCLESLFTPHTSLAFSPDCSPVTPDSLFICKTVHLSHRIACSPVTLDSLFTCHIGQGLSPATPDRAVHLSHRHTGQACSPVTPDRVVHLPHRICTGSFTCHTGQNCSPVTPFTCHIGQTCAPVTPDRVVHLPHQTRLFTCHTVYLSHWTGSFTCHTRHGC